MGDHVLMKVLYSGGNLLYFYSHLLLPKSFILLQMAEECASFHVLEYKINVGSVIKMMIETKDIFMVQISLELKFKNKLVDHEMRFDHLLRDFL